MIEKGYQARLTNPQIQTLRLIAQGLSDKEIAQKLSISLGATQRREQYLRQKLYLSNRVKLALYALKEGLIRLEDIRL